MAKRLKVVIDAGHGYYTNGKRSPADEREWSFNNKVVLAVIAELHTYANVDVLRVDDPSGKVDVPLDKRVKLANDWGADVYVSVHHNANKGTWGTWSGTETFVYSLASAASVKLAKLVQAEIVNAMGLKDRGVKAGNFAVIRDTKMPAILTEGGYMDSSIDIVAMRNSAKMNAQGVGIATGIANYLGLTKLQGGGNMAELTPAQEAVRQEAMKLGITDGKNPLREVNQHYVWNALIPMMKRIVALEDEIKRLK